MSLAHWSILAALGVAFGFNEILLSAYGSLTVSSVRAGLGAIGRLAGQRARSFLTRVMVAALGPKDVGIERMVTGTAAPGRSLTGRSAFAAQ